MKGIYLISNPVNSVYIGQSHDIRERLNAHKRSIHRQNVHRSAIRQSLIKHGVENHIFSILHELPVDISQNAMDSYEQFCIDQYKEAGVKILNLKDAGSRGKQSEETKSKVSASLTGKKQSQHTIDKRKNSILNISKIERDKQKAAMSNAAKNFYASEQGTEYKKIVSDRLKKHNKKPKTVQHLKRLSESHKGFKPTKESLIKKSNSLKEYWANLTPEQKEARVKLAVLGRLKNKR